MILPQQVSHIYSGPLEDDDDADDELSQAMVTCDPEVCVVYICTPVVYKCTCASMCIACLCVQHGTTFLTRENLASQHQFVKMLLSDLTVNRAEWD